jgi:hypothetical protein
LEQAFVPVWRKHNSSKQMGRGRALRPLMVTIQSTNVGTDLGDLLGTGEIGAALPWVERGPDLTLFHFPALRCKWRGPMTTLIYIGGVYAALSASLSIILVIGAWRANGSPQ